LIKMKKGLVVLFHEVNDAEWFEQIILLLNQKYSMVDMDHFEAGSNNKTERTACHVTFDDGHITFYTIAYPILKKYNIPTTLFVSPEITTSGKNFWFNEIEGYDNKILTPIIANQLGVAEKEIESVHRTLAMKCLNMEGIQKVIDVYKAQTGTTIKPSQYMNVNEITEVKNSGLVTIGAHTLHHPILSNESDEISNNEITASIKGLEELLKHKIKYFAYPNGIPGIDFTQREMDCLQKNNIRLAVTTETDYVNSSNNIYNLPRIGISHESPGRLKLKLFFGKWWERFRALRSPSEEVLRKKLYLLG
jgi:peptidoglycan/xylan/chitin deacetylase (PgdA/CDA1 family)